jgi:cytoskeletal protein CcmA (bactofilin family)
MFKRPTIREEPAPRVERKERNEQSFLQSGVRIEGDLFSEGDLRIDGQIKGTLRVGGLLTIGPKASIVATIRSSSVVVHGAVDGQIQVSERIHLARGAKVKADLFCQSLVIDEGVLFQGRSHMGETPATGATEAFSATEAAGTAAAAAASPASWRAAAQSRMETTTQPRPVEPVARADGATHPINRPQSMAGQPSVAEQARIQTDAMRRGPASPSVASQRAPDGGERPPIQQRGAVPHAQFGDGTAYPKSSYQKSPGSDSATSATSSGPASVQKTPAPASSSTAPMGPPVPAAMPAATPTAAPAPSAATPSSSPTPPAGSPVSPGVGASRAPGSPASTQTSMRPDPAGIRGPSSVGSPVSGASGGGSQAAPGSGGGTTTPAVPGASDTARPENATGPASSPAASNRTSKSS